MTIFFLRIKFLYLLISQILGRISGQSDIRYPTKSVSGTTLLMGVRRVVSDILSIMHYQVVWKTHNADIFNPITGRGGVNLTPHRFFNIAQKPLELLTYNLFTFPKYEVNMFSKKFSSIYFFWVYFSWTFWSPRPNFPSSPLIIILVDFDGHNANITLKMCTDLVYTYMFILCKNFIFLKTFEIWGGGRIDPPPCRHLQTFPLIGLTFKIFISCKKKILVKKCHNSWTHIRRNNGL